MITLKPPRLKSGDTIGVVAPCQPVLPQFREQYERGCSVLEGMGFTIKEGKTVGLQWGYQAGTPQEQAGDINAMFADPLVRALIATSGGHSAISVLEYLDYDLIRANPKPFIGMSDVSVYHLALYARTGLVGFHMDELTFGLGSNRPGGRMDDVPAFKQAYRDVLTSTEPLGTLPHHGQWESWRDGAAEGVLIGGNLNSMLRAAGTPYLPVVDDFDGALLFWEAVGQPLHEIRRCLFQLKYAGILECAGGMLIGTVSDVPPLAEDGITEPSLRDIVLEVTAGYDFPIMAGLDFGHYTVNLPMPVGVRARMQTNELGLALIESAAV